MFIKMSKEPNEAEQSETTSYKFNVNIGQIIPNRVEKSLFTDE